MAKRQFHLTQAEIRAFQQAKAQTRDVRELKRLQALRLYGTGESVGTIQKLVGCGSASPRQRAIEYQCGGLPVLRSVFHLNNRETNGGGILPDLSVAQHSLPDTSSHSAATAFHFLTHFPHGGKMRYNYVSGSP